MKNGKTSDTNITDQKARVTVPKHIRTRRGFARTLACIAVLIWAITYTTGIKTLKASIVSRSASTHRVLEEGSRWWAILSPRQADSCIGYLHTNLSSDEEVSLSIDGQLLMQLYSKPMLLQLDMDAVFTSYLKLRSFQASANCGKASLLVETLEDNIKQLQIAATIPTQSKVLKVERPRPVYLVRRPDNKYLLRLPEQFEATIEQQSKGLPAGGIENSSLVKEIDEADADVCIKQILSAKEDSENFGGAIDISPILSIFHFKPSQEIIKALTQDSK